MSAGRGLDLESRFIKKHYTRFASSKHFNFDRFQNQFPTPKNIILIAN